MIAVIYVDVEHQAVDQGYDYRVPEHLESIIAIGQRVKVPFGPRKITGIVVDLQSTSQIGKLKTVIDIVDVTPVFSSELMTLAALLSERYATPRMLYLNAMLPSGMRMVYNTELYTDSLTDLPESLKPHFNTKGKATMNDALKTNLPLIKDLIEQGKLEQRAIIKQKQSALTIPYVHLVNHETVKGTKQQSILDYLKAHSPLPKKDLLESTSSSSTTLKSLEEKGLVRIVPKEQLRELKSLYAIKERNITLSPEQQNAVDTVLSTAHQCDTYLLHGVTSSGKTEVYIELAKAMESKGKTTIILVPEISLTPALTARFKSVFAKRVAVYHSAMSTGEQYDSWRRIKRKEASVIIGARSAIFAPTENLGLIIMDEEHSDSYIQSDNPKYETREIAQSRAKHHSVPLVLGSATPSVESYYYAQQGTYTLLELKTRALDSTMPSIRLVDMKQEFLKGNKTFFSETLQKAMDDRIQKGEQTLILINRRGHANFVLCRSCGQTIECDACDVTMTYHHRDHKLKCHYCNHEKPMPKTCPNCDSPHIRYMGIGSERVEQALQARYKDATITRMDRDTTQTKNAHEILLHQFEEDGDFLVGTQMISKGLDLEKVTLVAVLSADMSLFVPDYYAKEETFSLLTQMAGRAGRRKQKGEVIIQAYHHNHPVLDDVQQHNYQHFYEQEIAMRQKAQIRPFKKMLALTITHEKSNEALKKATSIKTIFSRELSAQARIIGPIKPKMHRLNNRYRMHVLIKYDDEPTLTELINQIVKNLDHKQFTIQLDYHPRII